MQKGYDNDGAGHGSCAVDVVVSIGALFLWVLIPYSVYVGLWKFPRCRWIRANSTGAS